MAKKIKNKELRRKVDTRDFVKKTGRDKFWKLLQKQRDLITDKKTGGIRKEFLARVKCVICKKDDSEKIFHGKGFDFVRCKKCGLIYTNPRMKEEKVEKLYRGEAPVDVWVDVLTSPIQMEYDKKKFDTRLAILEKYVKKGKILDIGCSIGHFLKIAEKRGWDPYGLELNKRAANYARQKFRLKNIKEVILEKAGFPANYFSAAGMWGVLEHILNPGSVLKELHRVLKPGGVVIFSVPNAGSLAARILQEKTSCFDGTVHLWLYTEETLRKLLKKMGYKVLEISSEQPELDTILNYLDYQHPYLGRSRLVLDKKLKRDLENIILESNMGYKLIVIAQKPKK